MFFIFAKYVFLYMKKFDTQLKSEGKREDMSIKEKPFLNPYFPRTF